jgi:hypothetical protein
VQVGQSIITADHKLIVYDQEENPLYWISVMPSMSGDETVSLTSYKDENLVVYLQIFEAVYSNPEFSMDDVTIYANDLQLTETNRWDYGSENSCEFLYAQFEVDEDIIFTVNGVNFN